MSRQTFLLGIGLLALTGCLINSYGPSIQGSGTKATDIRKISDFRELSGIGIGNYQITSGAPASLKITTDDNLIPYVESIVDVKEEQLLLGIKKGNYNFTITPECEMTTKELSSIKLKGRLSLDAKQINTPQFTVKIEGQNQVVLAGTVEELTVRIDGQSTFQAADLKCKKVKIICNGMCTATVHGSEAVEVEANGMCTVDVLGKPAKKEFKTQGMSKVNEK